MDIVNQNLTFTPDWSQANCDPGRPAEYVVVAPNTDCVSYTSSLDRARVITPTIEVDTYFARTFGVDTIYTSANAEAGGRSLLGGAVLPFAIPSNLSGDNYECLRSGSNPQWGPCAGGTSGNYGYADMRMYGTEEFTQYNGSYVETTTRCNDADTNGRMIWNIVAGVDHPLTRFTGGATINDTASCPAFNAGPNQIKVQTGIGSALQSGLFDGSSAYSATGTFIPGRLNRGGNQIEVTVGNFADDTPLWAYLAPGACPGTSDHASMEACLSTWAGGVIFRPSLGNAVRYGWAIELTTTYGGCAPGQNCWIQRFRPVYLDTSWFGCTGNVGSGSCDTVHSPGEYDPTLSSGSDPCTTITDPVLSCGLAETDPPPNPRDIDAISAYMLQPGMVPPSIREPKPGDDDQLAYNLYR
jgi:hypothetical protein